MNDRDQDGGGAGRGRWRTAGHWLLYARLLMGLLLVAGLSHCPLWGQTSAAKSASSSRRWLLVVETSKSMQARTNAVLETVQELLASGLSGQVQAGDTLGVWTFNEELYGGLLPLQIWSPEAREAITSRTLTFLRSQKYEKLAKFTKFVRALNRVIKDSELITVILISSGDGKIQGTPLDDRINEYFERWRKQHQKERIPFVIVLRANNGQIADYSLNIPSWPSEMPRMPAETKNAEVAAANSAEPAAKTPPPVVVPPIIAEKEPKTEPAPTPMPEPAVSEAEASSAASAAVTTNEPVKVTPPTPAAAPVEVGKAEPAPKVEVAAAPSEPVKVEPAAQAKPPVEATEAEPSPVVPDKPAMPAEPAPAPATVQVSEPKEKPASVAEVKAVEPTPEKTAVAAPPPVPTPKPEPAPLEQPKPSPALQMTPGPGVPRAAATCGYDQRWRYSHYPSRVA